MASQRVGPLVLAVVLACSTLTYAHPALISANVLGAPAPSEQSGGLLSANVLGGSGVNVNVGDPHGKPYDSKIYPQGYDSNTYPEAYNTKYPQGGLVDANVLANKGVDGANSLVNSNVLSNVDPNSAKPYDTKYPSVADVNVASNRAGDPNSLVNVNALTNAASGAIPSNVAPYSGNVQYSQYEDAYKKAY